MKKWEVKGDGGSFTTIRRGERDANRIGIISGVAAISRLVQDRGCSSSLESNFRLRRRNGRREWKSRTKNCQDPDHSSRSSFDDRVPSSSGFIPDRDVCPMMCRCYIIFCDNIYVNRRSDIVNIRSVVRRLSRCEVRRFSGLCKT